MTALQAIDLARRMRKAQKLYFSINPKTAMDKKMEALFASKKFEKEFDMADIEDPANLEIDFPKANDQIIEA